MRKALFADRFFDGDDFHVGRALLLEQGEILGLVARGDVPADAESQDLGRDSLIAPGFIDVQVNGGGGVLFNDQTTPEGLKAIAAAHRRFGTTGLLPTLITDDRKVMGKAVAAGHAAMGFPGILGLHFEGPFLNTLRKGVHRADLITAMEPGDLDLLRDLATVGKSMLTVAPECVQPGFIKELTKAGLLVAAGHTDASVQDMRRAAAEGMTGVTHFSNAMTPMAGRLPGAMGACLTDDRLFAGIICDGYHVDPVMLQIAWRAKGKDQLMLVTDAMPSVGTEEPNFDLQGQRISLQEGRLVTAEGGLAGAHLAMSWAVARVVQIMGVRQEDALIMASRTPARFLGLQDQLGRLAPGYRADLVALDARGDVIGTWIAGAFEAAV
jgi:N-acetylglucosamine-6-phosphate deacetylase